MGEQALTELPDNTSAFQREPDSALLQVCQLRPGSVTGL